MAAMMVSSNNLMKESGSSGNRLSSPAPHALFRTARCVLTPAFETSCSVSEYLMTVWPDMSETSGLKR